MKTGRSQVARHRVSTQIRDKLSSFNHTACAVGFPTGRKGRHLVARDVGVVVVATIDDVIVSWTKNFDGETSTPKVTVSLGPSKFSVSSQSELDIEILSSARFCDRTV